MGLQDYNSWEEDMQTTTESTNPKDKIGRAKPPMHLIPATAMVQEAMVFGLGAKKYGPYNWRDKTVSASVYVAATYRHVMTWFDGMNDDAESGASHLAHARACLGILLDATAHGSLLDDRPPAGKTAELIHRFTATVSGVPVPTPHEGMPGLCGCNCADACPNGKTGSDTRCAVDQVEYLYATEPRPDIYVYSVAAEPTIDETESPDAAPSGKFWVQIRRHLRALGCSDTVVSQISGGMTFARNPLVPERFVYVAGPMRGYDLFNFPAFDAARDRFLRNGWNVISPADIDRASHDTDETTGKHADVKDYVYRDFYSLFYIAHTTGGAIAMLPGWENSTGAVAEFFLARWLGLKILDAMTGATLHYAQVNDQDLLRAMYKSLAPTVEQK